MIYDQPYLEWVPPVGELEQHAQRHAAELLTLNTEANSRWLSLVSADAGGCIWRLVDSRGVNVFPCYKTGAHLYEIRGYLAR